jgi:hypothetical protein
MCTVLLYCHRLATQLQLTNLSYRIKLAIVRHAEYQRGLDIFDKQHFRMDRQRLITQFACSFLMYEPGTRPLTCMETITSTLLSACRVTYVYTFILHMVQILWQDKRGNYISVSVSARQQPKSEVCSREANWITNQNKHHYVWLTVRTRITKSWTYTAGKLFAVRVCLWIFP